jgi:hypothetical protein
MENLQAATSAITTAITTNEGDIINVTKAVAQRSTLMQITRVKAANTFH